MTKYEHTVGELLTILLPQPRTRPVELRLVPGTCDNRRLRVVQVYTEEREGGPILVLEVR